MYHLSYQMAENHLRHQREVWVDWAKTILIYFIVVGHAGIPHYSYLWNLIFSFHVPGFFIISGYLYRPHSWIKTLTSFLVPIIVFSAVNLIFVAVYLTMKQVSFTLPGLMVDATKHFVFCRTDIGICLFTGLWFVIVLFYCRLILGDAVCKQTCVYKQYVFVGMLLLIFMTAEPVLNISKSVTQLNIYRILSCLPFMLVGVYLSEPRHKTVLMTSIDKNWWKITLICLLLYIVISCQLGPIDMFSNRFGGNYLLFFINALSSSFLVFCLSLRMPKSKRIAEIVKTLSTGTLLILGTHGMIIRCCYNLYKYLGLNNAISPFITGVVALLISYYPIRLCMRYCPKLLGKS